MTAGPAAMLRCGIAGVLVALLAACGGGGPPAPVAARPYDDPGFVADGEYEMRYGTLLALDIAPALAIAYGIDRRPDLAVLSVSILRRRPGETPLAVTAQVSGALSTLLGEQRTLAFEQLEMEGGVSYLAQFAAPDRQPVLLQFEARPDAMPTRLLRARLTREFSVEPR